jgi:hypothetical protein
MQLKIFRAGRIVVGRVAVRTAELVWWEEFGRERRDFGVGGGFCDKT